MAIENETLITLEAAEIPLNRDAKIVRKFCTVGAYGAKLESIAGTDGRLMTSRESVARFLAAVSETNFRSAGFVARETLIADLEALGITLSRKLAAKVSTRVLKAIIWNVRTDGGKESYAAQDRKRAKKAARK